MDRPYVPGAVRQEGFGTSLTLGLKKKSDIETIAQKYEQLAGPCFKRGPLGDNRGQLDETCVALFRQLSLAYLRVIKDKQSDGSVNFPVKMESETRFKFS